jgi:ubiquinone biosynthesis protein UbiJ
MLAERPVAVLESLLNQHISESTAARDQLLALADCSLAVHVVGTGFILRLDAGEQQLRIGVMGGDVGDTVTATISATPLTLLQLLRSPTVTHFRASGAELGGDTETVEAFAELLRLARPELEEELSHLVGDVAAHGISQSAQRLVGWGERSLGALTMNTSEFLQEEIRQLPPRLEVERFNREVERLREDADRVTQRVDRLLGAISGRAEWGGSD